MSVPSREDTHEAVLAAILVERTAEGALTVAERVEREAAAQANAARGALSDARRARGKAEQADARAAERWKAAHP